ncbi:MAG: hypothetical protein IPF98_01990 [Gemmatimonadetes bacterium]|jgi:hypothetical protein|nr:hypothetical protein [Gemmatimonadota bacterium]MCC6771089.1 hypothetical protein [Gemmatimonadaceae bacterium]
MPSQTSVRIGLGIGAVMIGLGLYIGARTLVGGTTPLTGTRWLDLAFAVFFVLRGALQVQRWRRATG